MFMDPEAKVSGSKLSTNYNVYVHFFTQFMSLYVYFLIVLISLPTLCNLMDYSLPGFSVHGILRATILEW